jgi:predicted lactoylglutathione lyase
MMLEQATVALPVENRVTAHAFYSALGFATVGDELEKDGLPEPLQFEISAGMRIMLIPTVGFGWLLGGRKRAARGAHGSAFVIARPTDKAVDTLIRRAREAGAKIVSEPTLHRWGYAGTFVDPDGHLWLVSQAEGVLAR